MPGMYSNPWSDRRVPPLGRGCLWWLPFAVVSAVLAADWAMNGEEPVSFLLTGIPPLVAATSGPRCTATVAVASLSLQISMGLIRSGLGTHPHAALYGATLLIGIASTMLSEQRVRVKEDLEHAESVAETMQRALLRPPPRRLGTVTAAAFYTAAESDTLIGGDLYDVCVTSFGVRAIIGDVRGKGLATVQTVAAVLGGFRVSAHEWADLVSLTDRLELSIARNELGGGTTDNELFVTALVMEILPGRREVRIVNRGHPPPIVVGPHGTHRLVTSPALPLGLGALSSTGAEITVHPLLPGQVLVAHTDGLSEARNAEGDFYPILERLAEHFRETPSPQPDDIVSFLQHDVTRWVAPVKGDDQAVLALTLHDAPHPR